jgi:tripartite-type tricarboxylate transporter receptor subunit TctC
MTGRRALLAAGLAGVPLGAARAQGVPGPEQRPLRIVVPFAPGGSSDVLARLLQPGMGTALGGQPVIVENRPGAGSLLGAEAVARSPADGGTVLLADLPFAVVPAVQERLPYDPVADFAPVTLLAVAPLMLFAHPAVPARDAAEFAALARARPDGFSYGSGGIGAASHLMGELFQRATGARLVHVPYRGGGPAVLDTAAGQVQAVFVSLASAAPQVQSGQVRPLGVAGTARLPALPDVPTFREQGIDLVVEHWWGLLAPARTPPAAVARLADAAAAAVRAPDLAPRLEALALLPRAEGPEPFGRLVRSDLERWGAVVRAAGIRAQ